MRCRRISSKTVRTDLLTWHRRRSPPSAEALLRQERMAPQPRLSTNCTRLRSSTTLRVSWKTGAICRLKSSALLASSWSMFKVTTATSPTLSTVGCMLLPTLASSGPFLDHPDAAAAAPVLTEIAHLVYGFLDQVDAEATFLAAIEDRRRRMLRVEIRAGV